MVLTYMEPEPEPCRAEFPLRRPANLVAQAPHGPLETDPNHTERQQAGLTAYGN